MESLPVPASLIGAAVFFGLLAMIAHLVIRETLRLVLKPALIVAGLALLAVWAGLLDETMMGESLTWLGDRLVLGLSMAGEWAASAWETYGGTPEGGGATG